MLKKKIVMLVAAAMMTLTASSAFAAFADLSLIRVYYDRTGSEIATDLGKVADFTAAGAVKTIDGNFGSLSGATSFAVYFAVDRVNNDIWSSGSTTTPSVITGGNLGMTSLKNGLQPVYNTYNTQGGVTYTGPASLTNSYKNKLSATQGTLANAINVATRLNTEVSLTDIIGGTGSRTQSLYYWGNGLTTVASEKIGQLAATIVTNADGSTVVTSSTPAPVATPIPAAFYLMGSGLMGLVGMRRRKNA